MADCKECIYWKEGYCSKLRFGADANSCLDYHLPIQQKEQIYTEQPEQMKKLKLFEMFSGYGGASFALKKADIPFECIGFSEIDKYAIQCYEQNHKGKNYGNCRNINPNDLPDFDLLTGGFPCQAFSVAGKMAGENDARGTLFYEIIRIAEAKKPKYMLLENVKGLTCSKFKGTFDKILFELDRIGYNVYWKVLNSKDYGIPQSRQRVWFVCIRKDIQTKFQFPEPEELKLLGKDILEKEVDNKYYLTEKMQERFMKFMEEKGMNLGHLNSIIFKAHRSDEIRQYKGIFPTLTESHEHKGGTNAPIVLQNSFKDSLNMENIFYEQCGFDRKLNNFREYPFCPTLKMNMGTGGGNVPIIVGHSRDKFGKTINYPLKEIFGSLKEPSGNQQDYVFATITTENAHLFGKNVTIRQSETIYKLTGLLRRLTPKECFRLMGFLNDEIKLEALSDTQCYKLAGNGWEINLASKIFTSNPCFASIAPQNKPPNPLPIILTEILLFINNPTPTYFK